MLFKRSNQEMHVYNKQYAVGQGGLHLSNIIYFDKYKNRWSHFAYIYDCGTIKENEELLKNTIRELVEDIKIQHIPLDNLYIFISHLHEDHLNGLAYLKNSLVSQKVISEHTDKRLFLPYTSNIEKNIIIGSYEPRNGLSREEYRKLITNPQDYFENFYDVYYVDDGNNNFEYIENDIYDNSCCNNIHKGYDTTKYYNHYHEFKIGNPDYWVLRMFYKRIDKNLIDEIRKNVKIDFNKVSDRTINAISEYYKTMLGKDNINQSSICLYSGPCSQIFGFGFMHTGDINLKESNAEFSKHYVNYLHNVVVAQIPHHGSIKNSKLSTFDTFNNLRLLYVTKQEKTNGSSYPHLNSEYTKNFVKQVTEKEHTSIYFANYHALDSVIINSPTIKEYSSNIYKYYTGILKFEYKRNNNFPEKLTGKNSAYITRASRNPKLLTKDKEIFLVLIDEMQDEKPVIVGRAKTYGYNKNNVSKDMDKYKYYVKLYDIDKIATGEKGIPLSDIIDKYGCSMFPTSNSSKPDYIYRQKSYCRISDEAKDYINNRLDNMDLVRL